MKRSAAVGRHWSSCPPDPDRPGPTVPVIPKPLLGRHCRFEPSCSQYFIEALRKYGAVRGSLKGVWRILRCNPWMPGGTTHRDRSSAALPPTRSEGVLSSAACSVPHLTFPRQITIVRILDCLSPRVSLLRSHPGQPRPLVKLRQRAGMLTSSIHILAEPHGEEHRSL